MPSWDPRSVFLRVAYFFVGLCAANVTVLITLLAQTLNVRSSVGQFQSAITFFVLFSGWGWLNVGLPFALFVPASFVQARRWPARVLIGLLLGPAALLLIFIEYCGRCIFSVHAVRSVWPFWPIASAMSTIAFVVYVFLLDKRGRKQTRDTAPLL
jgi:hypothetical protein